MTIVNLAAFSHGSCLSIANYLKAIKNNRQTNHMAVEQKRVVLSENDLNGRDKLTLVKNHSPVQIMTRRSTARSETWFDVGYFVNHSLVKNHLSVLIVMKSS